MKIVDLCLDACCHSRDRLVVLSAWLLSRIDFAHLNSTRGVVEERSMQRVCEVHLGVTNAESHAIAAKVAGRTKRAVRVRRAVG